MSRVEKAKESAKKQVLKAKEQNAQKLKDLREQLKQSKKEISENMRKFGNWRAKHPDEDLTGEYQLAAEMPKGDKKNKRLDELLNAYMEKYSANSKESQTFRIQQKTEKQRENTETELHYVDVCMRYKLDPDDEETEKKLAGYVCIGVLTRKKLPKKAADKVAKAGFKEGAQYRYTVVGTTKRTTQGTSEASTFDIEKNEPDADKRDDTRKRWFASLSHANQMALAGETQQRKSKTTKDATGGDGQTEQRPPTQRKKGKTSKDATGGDGKTEQCKPAVTTS